MIRRHNTSLYRSGPLGMEFEIHLFGLQDRAMSIYVRVPDLELFCQRDTFIRQIQ